MLTRRQFLKRTAAASAVLGLVPAGCKRASISSTVTPASDQPFEISLAQWSLHRAFFSGNLDPLDFAKTAREEFELSGIEYVNQFFKDKATDNHYLDALNLRARDHGVKELLIMVDGEGNLGEPVDSDRQRSVENHYRWVDAAAYLGCHSIRVNAGGPGDREVLASAVVDGLGNLATYASKAGIHVIVENHGGFSSDAAWLAAVITEVNMPNCGTLPDFGNFCVERRMLDSGENECVEEYDRYQGVEELMPFAKAVSAKSHDFDPEGYEIHTDYRRMMRIVHNAGYRGWVGIEYEGSHLDEYTGIRKTRDLLLRIRSELSVA
jgi:sugar phosphate isomerase/epimerase